MDLDILKSQVSMDLVLIILRNQEGEFGWNLKVFMMWWWPIAIFLLFSLILLLNLLLYLNL
jgi:hypothetical protein